jgi:hypothetical protein
MVRSRWVNKGYRKDRIVHWLAWLARQLLAHNRSVFYVEQLQPDWLSTQQRRWFAPGVALVAGLGVGSIVSVFYSLVYGPVWGLASGTLAVVGAMLVAPTIEKFGMRHPRLKPADEIVCSAEPTWSWELAKSAARDRRYRTITLAAILGVVAGLLLGIVITTERGAYYGTRAGVAIALGVFLIGWACHGAMDLVRGGLDYKTLDTDDKPNQGIRTSLRNARIFCLIYLMYMVLGGLWTGPLIYLLFWYMGTLASAPLFVFSASLAFGIWGWFLRGGSTVVKHFVVRILLACNGDAPLRYVRFLNFAFERNLLRKAGKAYQFIHGSFLHRFASRAERV